MIDSVTATQILQHLKQGWHIVDLKLLDGQPGLIVVFDNGEVRHCPELSIGRCENTFTTARLVEIDKGFESGSTHEHFRNLSGFKPDESLPIPPVPLNFNEDEEGDGSPR